MDHLPLAQAIKTAGTLTSYLITLIPDNFHQESQAFQQNILITVKTGKTHTGETPLDIAWHAKGDTDDDSTRNPDLSKIAGTKHLFCLLSTNPQGILQKEIITTPLTLKIDEQNVWGCINAELDNRFRSPNIGHSKPSTVFMGENALHLLGGNTLHRALPALNNGAWYYFKATLRSRD